MKGELNQFRKLDRFTIYQKRDKRDYSKSLVILLLPTAYENFRNFFSVQYNSLCRRKYINIFSVYLYVSINDGKYVLLSLDSREKKLKGLGK